MSQFQLLNVVNAGSIAAVNAAGVSDQQVGAAGAWTLMLVMDVTVLTGTSPSLQLLLEAFDDTSGKYIQWGTAFVAVTATGTFVYLIALGIAAAAGGVTATLSYPPPAGKWRVRAVGGGTAITAATFTVGASVQPNY